MYVQVRTIDGKQNVTVTVSKLTTVEQFKELIEKEIDVPIGKQRLFFRGKQLEDGYKIFDYNINVNDVVQLMIKVDLPQPACEESNKENQPNNNSESAATSNVNASNESHKSDKSEDHPCESKYFKIGDFVDGKDLCYGAWFEGKVDGIYKDINKIESELSEGDDGLLYKVSFQNYPDDPPLLLTLKDIRPRARHILPVSSVKTGDLVLVNHNIEEPKERGYWYDLKVTNINTSGRKKTIVKGILFVGTENTQLDDSIIAFIDEIMKIEPIKLISERSDEELKLMQTDTDKKRLNAPYCQSCGDNSRRKCKECGCNKCGGKNEPDKQIMCDECNMAFHISCLKPPLAQIPEVDEWYCSECKNDTDEIVKAGEKLKESKKKAKMASAQNNSTRDWGKGMACVGRTKECTLVPPNHFGPIPGVEVGTTWKFRVQVYPFSKFNFSVMDNQGTPAYNTRSKSNVATVLNKDVVPPSEAETTLGPMGHSMQIELGDESFTESEESLNMSAGSHLDSIIEGINGMVQDPGHEASEVGVHRPHVAGIHGRESDGAYSLVLSGGYEDDIDSGEEFFYTGSGGRDLSGNKRTAEQSSNQLLTRMNKALASNCNAALDTKNGAEAKNWKGGKPVRVVRNFKLGKHSIYAPEDGNRYDGIYKVVKYYPEKGKSGFIVWRYLLRRDDPTPAPWTKEGKARIESLGLEMVYPDGYLAAMEKKEKVNNTSNNKLKRFFPVADGEDGPQTKKSKVSYELEAEVKAEIEKDTVNSKLWEAAETALSSGKKDFLARVEETFMCICCQELVYQPVTTPCNHNMCLVCLQRSFSAEVFTCPYCRNELGKNFERTQNKPLQAALLLLFPGYTAGR